MDRYDLMRSQQQHTQPPSSTMIPVNESPVLPAPPPAKTVVEPAAAPRLVPPPLGQ